MNYTDAAGMSSDVYQAASSHEGFDEPRHDWSSAGGGRIRGLSALETFRNRAKVTTIVSGVAAVIAGTACMANGATAVTVRAFSSLGLSLGWAAFSVCSLAFSLGLFFWVLANLKIAERG